MAKPSPSHSSSPALKALGLAVRDARKGHNFSQEELALIAGLDRSYLGGVERGEHNVALINLIKLSNALGLKLNDLLKQADL